MTSPAEHVATERNRYELLRFYTNRFGVTFYEVADNKLGVIYWTKERPA